MKKLFNKDIFWLFLIILVSLFAIYPCFKKGFYSFHDEAHLANLYEMVRAISSGQFPPRWAPDMSFNYGHPFFNFYYPLPFYFGALINLLFGASLFWSLKIVFLITIPLSGLFFYLMMRKFFSRVASFSAGVIYMFTPYRAVDLYVRGAVGELLAFVFMPLVIFSFKNLLEKKSINRLILFSISLAGLILSHNLTAMMFLPPAFLIMIMLFIGSFDKKLIKWLFSGFILGLGLSAYYWLPAILEKKFMQPGTPFNPFDNFPFIKQLIIPFWGYGISQWGPGDGMSFQIGVINLLVVGFILLLSLFAKNKIQSKTKPLFITLLLIFFTTVFLMNIRSYFLWKIFPLGEYIQFPWRFLILTTFISSFIFGFLENFLSKNKQYLLLIFSLVSIILTWNYFKPQNQILVNDDYYLKKFFADRTEKGKSNIISKDYFNWSEDYLPLTIWTEKRPWALPPEKMSVSFGKIDIKEINPTNFKGTITTDKQAKVEFFGYYFPGWKSWVDGKEVKPEIVKPHGNMSVLVEKGEHEIVFKFEESLIRKISDILSIFSIITIILLFLFSFKRKQLNLQ